MRVEVVAADLGDHASAAQYDRAMNDVSKFLEVGRDDDRGRAIGDGIVNEPIYIGPRAHVDTLGRLVEKQEPR
jgi:hypothetical protein